MTLAGALLLLGLVATILLPRVDVPGRAVHLFRAFFPSWRFFEDVGGTPRLDYRVHLETGELGPWTDALPPVPRGPTALLLNPAGNLRFAGGSLVDQLVADFEVLTDAEVDDAPERGLAALERMVSFRLVQNLVATQLRVRPDATEVTAYELRLVLDAPDVPEAAREVILQTRPYPWTR